MTVWDVEGATDLLKRLYREGKSMSEIAAEVNAYCKGVAKTSRSSIAGKLSRAGLKRPPKTRAEMSAIANKREHAAEQRLARETKKAERQAAQEPIQDGKGIYKARTYEIPPTARILAQLPRGACKWPLTEEPQGHADEILMCGAVAIENKPYCESCAARARGPAAYAKTPNPASPSRMRLGW